MNFKQIEMVGFKSFADPIKITFSDGITAIVGPNGCGKSNVADAIRWVLGEQSSKMLRGTSMQDVIFKGTEKRKSLSFCEVSLCFDNTNKIFNIDYEEIVITRKLYRSGDSEYLLNHNDCRLKDIVDLLHDSGIGKSGYSIIGQGKVDEIINSKPEDRRAIFEEAAGIAKFKAKKIEAERKLERTQDNLTRINDIISEIDRQLSPLKKQSETAKIYLELKEKLKNLEINEYIYQYDYAAENKQIIQTKIDAIVEEMQHRQTELDDCTKDYTESNNRVINIDNHITELRDKMLELTVGIEKHAGETNVLMEQLKYFTSEKMRLEDELEKLQNSISAYDKDMFDNKSKNEQDKIHMQELNSSITDLTSKYDKITIELNEGEGEAQEAQRAIFEKLNKLGDVKAQISALQAEKNAYSVNIDNFQVDKQANESKLKTNGVALASSKLKIDQITSKRAKLNNELHDIQLDQNNCSSKLKDLETEINGINSSIISLDNRKKMLEEMQKEYEGFNGSVKRLLSASEQDKAVKSKIVGVLANLIKVPQTYQTAIELALGNAVQNVVTRSDEEAKQLINYLKQNQFGRVTFLPITTVKPRIFDARFNNLLSSKGCFGLASELISYDKQIDNVIKSLLGSTVIVNDIVTAVNMAKQSAYAFRIVTLEGDIISPQGSITGGSQRSQVANILSRETNIKETADNLVRLAKQKEIKSNDYAVLTRQYEQISQLLSDKVKDLHDIDVENAAEVEVYNKYSQIGVELENQSNKLESEIAKATNILQSIETQLNKMSVDKAEYNINEMEVSGQFTSVRAKRDEYMDALTRAKVELASLDSEMMALDQARVKLEYDIELAKRTILDNNTLLADINSKYDMARSNVKTMQGVKESKASEEELNGIKTELNSLDSTKVELHDRLTKLEDRRIALHDEVAHLQDKKYQQDLSLAKIDTDIETLQERVWTEYEITYATAIPYKLDVFDVKAGLVEINNTRKEINKLGNVNVNAIEDYKLLLERHGTMYEQAQDLIKAENDLRDIIKELAGEMVARFETEFNKINANFSVVFKELFGGGNAKLELVESEDVLDAGVDIIAEPPGKKLSNISLLSGGEKALTAIAILFAIIKLKPMPFCLLDEIEAALDEANVERFANYLRNFSKDTQFIVITHKKPTMEHADVLYGVTMEEKGVSKIVSVKLTDALKNVENA